MSNGDGKSDRARGPEAIVQELKSVLATSVAGNLRVAARVRDLLLSVASHDGRQQRAANGGDVGRILNFTLASVRLLSEQSLAIVNGLLDQAEAHLSPGAAAAPGEHVHTPPPAGVEIVLRGGRGERAGAAFLLENRYDRQIEVTLEMGDLTCEGRPPIPGAMLQVEPESVSLPPRGQAVIRVGIVLTDLFVPGTSYSGVLKTAGFETRDIHVRLEVSAASESPVKSAKAAESTAAASANPQEAAAPPREEVTAVAAPARSARTPGRASSAAAKSTGIAGKPTRSSEWPRRATTRASRSSARTDEAPAKSTRAAGKRRRGLRSTAPGG